MFFSSTTNSQRYVWGMSNPQTQGPQASREVAADASGKPIVLVTGANGKTGKIVAKKVKESEDYCLRALTRTEEVRPHLMRPVDPVCAMHAEPSNVCVMSCLRLKAA